MINFIKKMLLLGLFLTFTPAFAMNPPNNSIRFKALSTSAGIFQIISGGACFMITKYGALLFKTGDALLPFSEGASLGIKTFTALGGCFLIARGVWDILQPSRWIAEMVIQNPDQEQQPDA